MYGPRGDLQLIVESLKPAGQGALFEQFLRLKAQLEDEGLFDAERKRELPSQPRSIGVVTSLGAAALRDVVTALRRRVPHIPVVIYPAAVQGAQAPAELCGALRTALPDAGHGRERGAAAGARRRFAGRPVVLQRRDAGAAAGGGTDAGGLWRGP